MIEYVEIRRKSDREFIGIIDDAQSVIWHSVYFGVGDFEIYAEASDNNLALLVKGNYVTIPNDIEIGIIENIDLKSDAQGGTMITATGRFAKSILDRRQIYNLSNTVNSPTILRGNVETAVREVVKNNAISCSFDYRRNISMLELGTSAGIPAVIVDENGNVAQKQVSYDNLLDYTDSVLQEYNIGSSIIFDEDTRKFKYICFVGVDRSADNTSGNEPVIFSEEYDNLTGSSYSYNEIGLKTAVLIGGEGEGYERFYSVIKGTDEGLERRETWLDASSIARVMKETELLALFPTGVFTGTVFSVSGTVVANIVADTESEHTLSQLQSKFPAGTVSGTKFNVGGVAYATLKYGETDAWNYTPYGYRKALDADEKEGEYQLTESTYRTLLNTAGKQELAKHKITESFAGTLDVTGGIWRLNEDYSLGDIVTVQSNRIGKYANVRITEVTEVQDENGYSVDITYQN